MTTDTAPTGEPKKTSRAGRNLPAAIAVGVVLGGTVIATLLWAPQLWVALVALAVALATHEVVRRLREGGYHTRLIGKSHLQNITDTRAQYPTGADAAFDGEARRTSPGRLDQECGPLWDEDPAFDVDLPFYGFEQVRLVINHGDTAGGHYKRWLKIGRAHV